MPPVPMSWNPSHGPLLVFFGPARSAVRGWFFRAARLSNNPTVPSSNLLLVLFFSGDQESILALLSEDPSLLGAPWSGCQIFPKILLLFSYLNIFLCCGISWIAIGFSDSFFRHITLRFFHHGLIEYSGFPESLFLGTLPGLRGSSSAFRAKEMVMTLYSHFWSFVFVEERYSPSPNSSVLSSTTGLIFG